MKQDYTHITVLLDRSGSMAALREDTIGGFNRFLKEHQKAAGQCTLSLHQFDDEFETLHNFALVQAVAKLTNETFEPRGNTALLGAIGKAIDLTGQMLKATGERHRPAKVLFVIITDGLENHSHVVKWAKDKTRAAINDKIKHQTDVYKWEFVYIGANQDAIHEARDIGIAACNALDYSANAVGTSSLYASLADNTVKFRSGENVTSSWTTADRKAQLDAK